MNALSKSLTILHIQQVPTEAQQQQNNKILPVQLTMFLQKFESLLLSS